MPKMMFVDRVQCDMGNVKPERAQRFIQDSIGYSASDGKPPPVLVVQVKASHAALVTRNHGFYIPDRMKDGLATWTTPFHKPVQIHHDDHQDPIGRVRAASYVDLSNRYLEPLQGFRDRFGRDTTILDKKSDTEKIFDQVKWVMQNFATSPNYEGLGYSKLDLYITDVEAAKKIIDERYFTVSVAFGCDEVYCSHCKADWAAEGPCEHQPGQIVDDWKVVLIPGNHINDEVSYVNNPADQHAYNLEVTTISTPPQDIVYESEDKTRDYLTTPILLGVSGGGVYRIDSFKDVEINRAEEIFTVTNDSVTQDSTTLETPEIITVDKTGEDEVHLDEAVEPTVLVDAVDIDPEAVEAISNQYTDEVFEDEAFYETYFVPVLTELGFENAILDAEARAELKKAQYCGPSAAFPVVDHAHVLAARKILESYSGSGRADRWLAGLNRKARADGFDQPATPSTVDNPIVLRSTGHEGDPIEIVAFTGEELLQKLDAVDLQATPFNLEEVLEVAAVFGIVDAVQDKMQPTGVEMSLEEKIDELDLAGATEFTEETVDMIVTKLSQVPEELRSGLIEKLIDKLIGEGLIPDYDREFNTLMTENNNLQDRVSVLSRANRDLYAARQAYLAEAIVSLKRATKNGGYDLLDEAGLEERRKELVTRSIDSLQDTIADLLSDVTKTQTTIPDETNDNRVDPSSVKVEDSHDTIVPSTPTAVVIPKNFGDMTSAQARTFEGFRALIERTKHNKV